MKVPVSSMLFYGLMCSYFLISSTLFVGTSLFLFPTLSFSQQQQEQQINSSNNNNSETIQSFKSETSESFVIPYQLANNDRRQPTEYFFEEPTSENWILSINNDLRYTNAPESKTVIKIKEQAPSEKFVDLILFGDQSKRFIVSVNTNETGYMRMYENSPNGWSTDNPVTVSHANIQGLTVNNGQRIVLDKLGLDGFTVGSIQVYGKDEPQQANSATGGSIQFEVLSGDYSQSILYYVPLIMIIIVAGVVLVLLKFKKRN